MRKIKNYNLFIFENATEMVELFNDVDILESIVTDTEILLKTIKAEEVDLYQTFTFNPDDIKTEYTIQELYDNIAFNDKIVDKGYKKNILESTIDNETFIDDNIIINFFSLFDKNDSELGKPKYIIFQSKKANLTEWTTVKCYKVNDDMKHFYSKLTNKTIEFRKNDKIYIYNTSNSGNDWLLQSLDGSDDFKKHLTNDDIKVILIDKNISITIIA